MADPVPDSPVPAFIRAAGAIRLKYLVPGVEVLPAIPMLAEEFGVSKATAEKAVALLSKSGEVYAINGRGTFVKPRAAPGKAPVLSRVVLISNDYLFDPTFWFPQALLGGMQRECRDHRWGFHVLEGSVAEQVREATRRGFLTDAATGFITTRVGEGNLRGIAEGLRPFGRNLVALGQAPGAGLGGVSLDNAGGVRRVVRHLWSGGRRRLRFLGSRSKSASFEERRAAFHECLPPDAVALPDIMAPAVEHVLEIRAGYMAMADLLRAEGYGFDAVVAVNDAHAAGALMALKERGVAVPEEVAVCGFDDERRIAEGFIPSITSVRFDAGEWGRRLVRLLMTGKDQAPVETTLVIRESSGRPRG